LFSVINLKHERRNDKIVFDFFGILVCFEFFQSQPDPETYLTPQGFAGWVSIVFSRVEGVPPKYENGRRVYQIPVNGILLTH